MLPSSALVPGGWADEVEEEEAQASRDQAAASGTGADKNIPALKSPGTSASGAVKELVARTSLQKRELQVFVPPSRQDSKPLEGWAKICAKPPEPPPPEPGSHAELLYKMNAMLQKHEQEVMDKLSAMSDTIAQRVSKEVAAKPPAAPPVTFSRLLGGPLPAGNGNASNEAANAALVDTVRDMLRQHEQEVIAKMNVMADAIAERVSRSVLKQVEAVMAAHSSPPPPPAPQIRILQHPPAAAAAAAAASPSPASSHSTPVVATVHATATSSASSASSATTAAIATSQATPGRLSVFSRLEAGHAAARDPADAKSPPGATAAHATATAAESKAAERENTARAAEGGADASGKQRAVRAARPGFAAYTPPTRKTSGDGRQGQVEDTAAPHPGLGGGDRGARPHAYDVAGSQPRTKHDMYNNRFLER